MDSEKGYTERRLEELERREKYRKMFGKTITVNLPDAIFLFVGIIVGGITCMIVELMIERLFK